MTPNRPSSPPTPSARRPTAPQQRVLERIAAQRARLRARSAQRHQLQTEAASAQGVSPDVPMLQRLAMFAKLHPVAVTAVLGAALVAGPRRLVRWAGVVLPLIMQLRGR